MEERIHATNVKLSMFPLADTFDIFNTLKPALLFSAYSRDCSFHVHLLMFVNFPLSARRGVEVGRWMSLSVVQPVGHSDVAEPSSQL